MLYNTAQKRVVLSIWFLLFPSALFVAYKYFPIGTVNPLDISLNLLLLVVIMMLPLRLESVTLTLERWILFYIFFRYGLIVEMVFMQIGMFVLLFSDKSSTPKVLRFASNSNVFLLVSLSSGLIYYGLGGALMEQSLGKLVLLGFIYASSYSIINNLLLYLNFKYVRHKMTGFLDSVYKDYFITIVLLQFAIALSFLTETLQNKAFLLVGMPCILLLLIAKKYVRAEGLNEVLTSSSEIGHQLAGNLHVSDVLDTFVAKLKSVLPYDNAYIVDLRGGEKLVMLRVVEEGRNLKEAEFFNCPDFIVEGDGLDSNETNVYPSRKFIDKLERYDFSHEIQSLMTTPLKRNSTTEGFLFLTSSKKYIFTDLHAKMVDLLAGYVTASIDKAKYYEKTIEKSERCGLTGLNNYRYLERKLDEEMIRFHTNEIDNLSVIILDIDHFKSINDTYGHQSGNDILCAFANLLRQHISGDATLARYGGEEFVILLPNYTKQQATKLAEAIRAEIEETSFSIIPDLSEDRVPTIVNMTISGGVAAIPEDSSGSKDLLRNADRALYISGKQAGRNRIGVYGLEIVLHSELPYTNLKKYQELT